LVSAVASSIIDVQPQNLRQKIRGRWGSLAVVKAMFGWQMGLLSRGEGNVRVADGAP